MRPLLALLLGCHPPRFRRRFGAEMAAAVDQAHAELRGRPLAARAAWSARTAADLSASAAAEWWTRLVGGLRGTDPVEATEPVWPRLRGASPQRTAPAPGVPFTPLPELRHRHAGRSLPREAPTMR